MHNYSDLLLLQQDHVLSELNHHISEYPDSSDSTKKTLLFLEACSSLFEHGFLSSDKVESMNCDVMKHITKGYKFFTDWFMKVLEEGMDYRLTISFHFFSDPQFKISDNMQRRFLSWQSKSLFQNQLFNFLSCSI